MADQETVTVERRRKTEQSGPRQRAEAPQRRQTDSGGSAPPPSGGGGSGGGSGYSGGGSTGGGYTGGSRPGGGGSMQIPGGGCGLAIVVLLVIGFFLLRGFGGGGSSDGGATSNDQVASQPVATEAPMQAVATEAPVQVEVPTLAPTVTPRPAGEASGAGTAGTAATVGTKAGQTWTVLLYQDADDQVLEKDIMTDLNEAERVGSTGRVNIVSQIDRYKGAYSGDGNWDDTRRYYIKNDQDLNNLNSQLLQKGEANMSDGNTLVDFVKWGMENYPADKYVLILSDHGMGWPGGWSDPNPGGTGPRGIPLARAIGDDLYLMELDDALATIQRETGLDKFEIIGMDACLMSHLEVFNALEPYAHYAVASQETEPALGWAYTAFLDTLTNNPDISGADLSKSIVDTYISGDQRIVDDKARAEMLSRGSFLDLLGGPTAAQIADQMSQDVTLTAMDLAKLPALNDAVNNFAVAAQQVDPRSMAKARQYAQSYTSIFGSEVPPSYIDLGNFAGLVKKVGGGSLSQAADGVIGAIQNAVIAEKHGPNKPGSTGVSIYFPTSQLYGNAAAGPQSYVPVARRFAENSLWDEFLAYFYTGKQFEPQTRGPAIPAGVTRAPGNTAIQVGPIQATSTNTAPGKPITLTAEINGKDIGYIYFFTGYYDEQGNSINVVDMDYLEAPDTREEGGVYYPVWPEDGSFNVQFKFEPLAFALTDGATTAEALLTPQTYGASADQATYTVEGTYTFANGDPPLHARAYLRDGVLRQIFAFNKDDGAGAPWEVTIQPGDTFTVQQKWLDLDQNGQVKQVGWQDGETITLGNAPVKWEELDAAAGDYVVGFIVEDLDGNQFPVYQKITVQ
ncbi:MAG: clostripain-related cysteine peptidase [Caldilineaceae bacterium]